MATVPGEEASTSEGGVFASLRDAEGKELGQALHLPIETTHKQLELIVNSEEYRPSDDEQVKDADGEHVPFLFFVGDREIRTTENLKDVVDEMKLSLEDTVNIIAQPQAVFRVRSVTRCSASLPGHTEAVLTAQFSPCGTMVASGSGDATVRIWDMNTQTPSHTFKGHTGWVLSVAWDPRGGRVASGAMDKSVRVWRVSEETTNVADGNGPSKGQGGPMKAHTAFVTCVCWRPLHLGEKALFASASKDCTVRIWDADSRSVERSLNGHKHSVTCVVWCGDGLVCTGSQDKTIKVWNGETGVLVRSLDAHGHWVNHLALSSAYALRNSQGPLSKGMSALQQYKRACSKHGEVMVSASDDNTLMLWNPSSDKKPIARMTGHLKPVNHVVFSPDGSMIASASFDKSVKLWDGRTGKFMGSLHGHVGAVYQVAWSSDSRLILSASKDSTLKVWDVRARKLVKDLPGHSDEVFTVDWSADGQLAVSGSKDCLLRTWRR